MEPYSSSCFEREDIDNLRVWSSISMSSYVEWVGQGGEEIEREGEAVAYLKEQVSPNLLVPKFEVVISVVNYFYSGFQTTLARNQFDVNAG